MGATRLLSTDDAARCGVTVRHWVTLAQYAQARRYVLCIRAGKPASVRWIEQGFPAKPIDFKLCKVDPSVGLLFAAGPAERAEARRASYPLLESVARRSGEFVARLEGSEPSPDARFSVHSHPWLREVSALASRSALDGLVIHPERRLPITSDYDVAAVIDTVRFDHYQTFGSMAGGASRANLYTQAISHELNRLFQSERIMHGTEAQFVRAMGAEYLLAFRPDGRVEGRPILTTLEMDQAIRDLILRYAPSAAPGLGPH